MAETPRFSGLSGLFCGTVEIFTLAGDWLSGKVKMLTRSNGANLVERAKGEMAQQKLHIPRAPLTCTRRGKKLDHIYLLAYWVLVASGRHLYPGVSWASVFSGNCHSHRYLWTSAECSSPCLFPSLSPLPLSLSFSPSPFSSLPLPLFLPSTHHGICTAPWQADLI